MGWPGVSDCSTSYDPRFRDWYAGAAAGPKDVVIVIDVSGSMNSYSRMQLAREAAIKVVDTFTTADYATVIKFSSTATKYSAQLLNMDRANREAMKQWMGSSLNAGGGTNFIDAFEKVSEVFQASASATSNCNRVVLFLSDGEPNSWSPSDYVATTAKLASAKLLTYAFGSGAPTSILKQLACDNQGIVYTVSDGATDLGDVMSSYYKLLSLEGDPCHARWIDYDDIYTGTTLTGVCMAAFRKDSTAAASSCAGGTASHGSGSPGSADYYRIAKLIGVACVDMSLIASDADLRANPGWAAFEARMRSEQTLCARRNLTEGQLEHLRRDVSVLAMCGTAGSIPSSLITEPTYQATGTQRTCSSSLSGEPNEDGEGSEPPIGIIIPFLIAGVVVKASCDARRRKQREAESRSRQRQAAETIPPQAQATVVNQTIVNNMTHTTNVTQAGIPMQPGMAMPMQPGMAMPMAVAQPAAPGMAMPMAVAQPAAMDPNLPVAVAQPMGLSA